jgi:predicted DNA binding CopG/RHH family protein
MYTNAPMNGTALDKQVSVRLAEPVIMHLRKLADKEQLKVADLIRKAIRETYGAPKK